MQKSGALIDVANSRVVLSERDTIRGKADEIEGTLLFGVTFEKRREFSHVP